MLIELKIPACIPDCDELPVHSWIETMRDQTVSDPQMEVGDTFALLDRSCFTEAWKTTSRRVFVTRISEAQVLIHDSNGELVDEPENFTPGGLQAYAGDHSFLEEWGDYYICAQSNFGAERMLLVDAGVSSAGESDEEEHLATVEKSTRLSGGVHEADEELQAAGEQLGEHQLERHLDLSVEDKSGDKSDNETPLQEIPLPNKLVPGARLLISHPTEESYWSATVYLRKAAKPHDVVVVTYDADSVSPQFLKLDMTPEFIEEMTPAMYLRDADDIALAERCVGMFPTRCAKGAEGFFYGQWYTGFNNSILAPDTYSAAKTANAPRIPSSFHCGAHVTLTGRPETYVFLKFLIAIEPGQARFFALLANPAALLASPTLIARYVIVSMKTGAEASFQASLIDECEPETLSRLKTGADIFTADVTAVQLKNNMYGPSKVRQRVCLPVLPLASDLMSPPLR